MKKNGMTAAILIGTLLMIGIVSALTVNETQEKYIMIRGIGPDTLMTSDGQVFKIVFHDVNKDTQIGTSGVDAGSGLIVRSKKFLTTNWTKAQKYTIRVEPKSGETSKNDEVVMIGSVHNSSSLASINNIPCQGPGPKIGNIHNSSLGEVSGSVAPGYAGILGPFSWNAGDPVRVSAAWTPANQDVFLGIYDMAHGLPYVDLKRGGSGTYATTVPHTGSQWALIIWNSPSYTASVNYTLDDGVPGNYL